MPIQSWRELARTTEGEVRGTTTATRTFVLTLADNTLENNPPTEAEIISTLSLDNWGSLHPSLSFLGLRKLSITERHSDSPYHVQVVAEYGLLMPNDLESPTDRDAEWTFAAEPAQVPAFYYWDGTTRRPLVNSAKCYFEGLTTEEQIVRATIKKNYANFPAAQMRATNMINSGEYFGCPAHSWKVAGVNATYTVESYNNVTYYYWAATCELVYRESKWNLRIPDIGWNFIDAASGQKRRAMVFDFENGEWVASANPVALNGSGQQSSSFPYIHDFRVNYEANFSTLFGTPPT
jgi:hypothetical protein